MSPPLPGAQREPPSALSRPQRFFTLRMRMLGLVMLVLVPWAMLVLYTQADERAAAIRSVNRDAMRLIRIVTSNQAAQIEAAQQLLMALARLPQLRAGNAADCTAFLAEMLPAYPRYLNLGVAERDGTLSCSALPLPAPVNIADREYFRRAIAQRRFVVGDYQIGRVTRLPSINYAYPILDATAEVDAVVYLAQSLGWLGDALANLEFPAGTVLLVTDRNGTVLARMPDAAGWIGRMLPEGEVLAAIARQAAGGLFEADDAQGVRRLWAHAPLNGDLGVHATIGVPRSVALADIDRRLQRNLAGLALVTLIALGAAWFGSKYILRQVDALVNATRRLASGQLDTRAPVHRSRSELDFLAAAFNRMAAMLQTRDRDLRAAEERTRAAEIELAVTRAHLDIARQIQKSLLPEDPLTLPAVRLAGRCLPAVAVGGDYFGYFPREQGGVDLLVGDVSGHGVGAALLMAEARTTFLAERLVSSNAARILAKLNQLLHDDLDRAGLFMSACCATFDAATRMLSYASAGHPPALLVRAGDDTTVAIDADGVLLGISKDAAFVESNVRLEAGDVVVFYTDGITETSNADGELFGAGRLGEVIAEHRHDEPATLIEHVLDAINRFGGRDEYEDDVTIVAMKVTGATAVT